MQNFVYAEALMHILDVGFTFFLNKRNQVE